ncbi:MAG: hypothetical protein IIX61_00830 [Loktanella sp.]|nr:hypothetical protein [Loktanella sp.]
MSNMAQPDDIDALVSSVRNLVAHRDAGQAARRAAAPLVLTPALRVDESQPEAEAMPEPATAPDIHDKAAIIEDAVLSQQGDWEEDGGEKLDNAAWAASAFLMPELEPANALEPSAESQTEDRHTTPLPLDEEALRALIVSVVREELSGAMGEKITQNVRKMVRREINRLLANQQLD